MTSFAISETSSGDVAVIAARGEIDVATAPALARRLGKVLRVRRPLVVVDLGETLFIDATGLAVLLSALRRVTRCGGRLAVACANPTVLRLFEVTKTASTFDIYPTREVAVDHVAEREDVVVELPTGGARRAREEARRQRAGAGSRPPGA
jgi:anti-sigma B factor antagonist